MSVVWTDTGKLYGYAPPKLHCFKLLRDLQIADQYYSNGPKAKLLQLYLLVKY